VASPSVPAKAWTTEDLLDLPDDGIERYLIDGELIELTGKPGEGPMTVRSAAHSTAESRIAFLLWRWLETQREPRGKVASGEAGFVLTRNRGRETTVGIDVAYVSQDMKVKKLKRRALFVGPPILAVEILSPTDDIEKVRQRLTTFLRYGTGVVWVVDPGLQTVTVYVKGQKNRYFQVGDTLTDIPHLPGFSCAVAEFFR